MQGKLAEGFKLFVDQTQPFPLNEKKSYATSYNTSVPLVLEKVPFSGSLFSDLAGVGEGKDHEVWKMVVHTILKNNVFCDS